MSGWIVNPTPPEHFHCEGRSIPYSHRYGVGTIFVCGCGQRMVNVDHYGPKWRNITAKRADKLIAKQPKPAVILAWESPDAEG